MKVIGAIVVACVDLLDFGEKCNTVLLVYRLDIGEATLERGDSPRGGPDIAFSMLGCR